MILHNETVATEERLKQSQAPTTDASPDRS